MSEKDFTKQELKKLFLLAMFMGTTAGLLYCHIIFNNSAYASTLVKFHHKLILKLKDGTRLAVTTKTETDLRTAKSSSVASLLHDSETTNAEETNSCVADATSSYLLGDLKVDKNPVKDVGLLLKSELKFVEHGGAWHPKDCEGATKVAIIIPYRNRLEHLYVFLRHIHPIMKRQKLNYQILVINQIDDEKFNRGKLLNVGFVEAMKLMQFDCVIFQDVDLLPMNDKNLYNCDTSPKHMSVLVDKLGNKILYEELFGGVEAIVPSQFEAINGFSNAFWGWGAEDDNFYSRVIKHGLQIWRPTQELGKYSMLDHHNKAVIVYRHRKLYMDQMLKFFKDDGLSNLQYNVTSIKREGLCTFVNVDLKKAQDRTYPGMDKFSTSN